MHYQRNRHACLIDWQASDPALYACMYERQHTHAYIHVTLRKMTSIALDRFPSSVVIEVRPRRTCMLARFMHAPTCNEITDICNDRFVVCTAYTACMYGHMHLAGHTCSVSAAAGASFIHQFPPPPVVRRVARLFVSNEALLTCGRRPEKSNILAAHAKCRVFR